MTAWWESDPDAIHQEAMAMADSLRRRQYMPRKDRAQAALSLYRASDRIDLSGLESSWAGVADDLPPHNNIIGSAVDWFTSTMLHDRIRPLYMPIAGDLQVRERVSARQRACDGLRESLDLYGDLGALRCMDGFLFDGGGVKFAADVANERAVASRVRPWEFFVPEREARLGNAWQATHSQLIERSSLRSMFPEDSFARRLIDEAEPERLDLAESAWDDRSDMLLVRECWHRPTVRVDFKNPTSFGLDSNHDPDPDAKPEHDGRRVLLLSNGVLNGPTGAGEPWPYDHFGISWFKPFREPVGYWSMGIPEIIGGNHLAILEIADLKRRYLRRHAVPHLLLWSKAGISKYHLSNDETRIWTTKVPPAQAAMYLQTNAVPAELLREEELIKADAKERLGVTNMNLFGEKPPGIDHAPGMDTLSEHTQIRQTKTYQAWERCGIDDAKILDDMLLTLAQQCPNMELVFEHDKRLVKYNWRDIEADRNKYAITRQPTNYFATTPTAKARQLKDWAQAGMFNDTPQARKMIRIMGGPPDVDAVFGDQTAFERDVDERIRRAMKGEPDETWIPDPYMDLELGKERAKLRLADLSASNDVGPEYDRVRRFYELCDELSHRAAPVAGPTTQIAPAQLPGAPPTPALSGAA